MFHILTFLCNFATDMRKILFVIVICLTVACHQDSPQVASNVESAFDWHPDSAFQTDTAALLIYKRGVAKELTYYMERHDSTDEGYNMVRQYAEMGDSILVVYCPLAPIQLNNIGRWRNFPRAGTGLVLDAYGRPVIGLFENDTLVSGIRLDSAGVYGGRMSGNGEAEGYGAYRSFDGSYYEGQWHLDRREGFGLSVSDKHLHVGLWCKNRFMGERMHYTPNRIYGLDISRYQHEKGRKRFNIDWKNLRIVGLGHRISNLRVNGVVDYPVSFVYIKSTEGISIKNRYFMSDYTMARRQAIATGAYHFFSTRQSPLAQATYFLQNSCFRRGDLPPMLDVEPSDAQIVSMGGAPVLFDNIRKWLKHVEAHVGVRPILYVNQRFIKKYLDQAPDLKHDYHVWIARYGEYKPDVHLTFWQLSADGRVRGIHSEVDLNVFNGYQNQWDDFLHRETIK